MGPPVGRKGRRYQPADSSGGVSFSCVCRYSMLEQSENTAGGRRRRTWIEGNPPHARTLPYRRSCRRRRTGNPAMTVILNGPGGKIVMAAPGKPMLGQPLSGTLSASDGPQPELSDLADLAGWWDAGLASGVIGPTGTPLTAFGAPASGVTDKSGAGAALTVWHAVPNGSMPPMATPRLNGLLGGIGLNMTVPPANSGVGQQLPFMDPDQGLISATMNRDRHPPGQSCWCGRGRTGGRVPAPQAPC